MVWTPGALPAAAALKAGAPGTVAGLRLDGAPSVSAIPIAWQPVGDADTYKVECRRHDSADEFKFKAKTPGPQYTLRLPAGVAYDIRVVASNKDNVDGEYSYVLTSATLRIPQWADLVVSGDGTGQIDVTHVQMLFFTVITAIFVSLTVITSYTIPEIPQGFLILMGISNGVYFGSKFVPGSS